MPSLQNSVFSEGIVMGRWGTNASLRWEQRPTYWPVVLGDDGAHILWELLSKWNWEVFPQNGRWRGRGVTVMAPLFPAANFNFDMSVWVPMVSRRAKWLFGIQTRGVRLSHALRLKSKSPCQYNGLYNERQSRSWTGVQWNLMSLLLLYIFIVCVYMR